MACVGVKCHKAGDLNVLNRKEELWVAPHGTEYLQITQRNIRVVILDSDAGAQGLTGHRGQRSKIATTRVMRP